MKERIDKVLVKKGMVVSRTKAQELLKDGLVKVNDKVVLKSNIEVSDEDTILILQNDKQKYVSRGGLKLEKAINTFDIDLKNKKVLDIGSSTGGFTDCALKHGAKSVIAVDVGTNVMDSKLRNNEKILLLENTNFKDLNHNYFDGIDIAVCDVSFISLKKIIEKIKVENVNFDIVCLIKPQFECGKEIAKKYKGVILDKSVHIDILSDMISFFRENNLSIKGLTVSPIQGGDGNIEYLVYLTNKKELSQDVKIDNIIEEAFVSVET